MCEIDNAIETLLDWSNDSINSQQEPPWALSSYIKLKETLEAVKDCRESTISLEDSLLLEQHQETYRQQEDGIVQLDTFRHRPYIVPIKMPM